MKTIKKRKVVELKEREGKGYAKEKEENWNEKLQLIKRRIRRRRPRKRWKKCNPVRKKKTQL